MGIKSRPKDKGMFAIWAEENASLSDNAFEWAFGNGSNTGSGEGLAMPFNCSLAGVSLDVGSGTGAEIEVYINGLATGATSGLATAAAPATKQLANEIPVAAGDVINFRTVTGGGANRGKALALLKIEV